MAKFFYNRGLELIAKNDLDCETATLKARLVMTNTTCDTEKDKLTNTGFTDIDAHGTATDQTLANVSITRDDVNDRIIIDADNIIFSALAAGARQSQGLYIYQDLGAEASNVPVAYLDFPSLETHTGDDFPVNFHATNGFAYFQA